MSLKYTVIKRKSKKNYKKDAYYALFIHNGRKKATEFAGSIGSQTNIETAQVEQIITLLGEEFRNSISEGMAIEWGNLGSFFLSYNSQEKENAEEVLSSSIDKVSVKFRPCNNFNANLFVNKLKFENIPMGNVNGFDETKHYTYKRHQMVPVNNQ